MRERRADPAVQPDGQNDGRDDQYNDHTENDVRYDHLQLRRQIIHVDTVLHAKLLPAENGHADQQHDHKENRDQNDQKKRHKDSRFQLHKIKTPPGPCSFKYNTTGKCLF